MIIIFHKLSASLLLLTHMPALKSCIVHIIDITSLLLPLGFNDRLLQELLMEVDLMNLKLFMVKH